jgi:hypothetical protein
MEVVLLEKKAFEELVNKIDEIKQSLSKKEEKLTEKWLDNKEFMEIMKISVRTAQFYRDEGIISFSQIGNKIYYKPSDVEALFMKNYKKGFKKWN